ncbi:MAG: DUF1800 domain-containing protein [Phycisphaerae bacterium]|nr:DUF1800 domain-containing protein [Gemmatimonadaceae bacterium]
MRTTNTSSPLVLTRSTRRFAGTLSTLMLSVAAMPVAVSAQTKTASKPSAPAASAAAREQTADQQVQHVLSRLAFGARPGDVQAVRALGVDAWIARQLEPQKVSDSAMDAFLRHFPTLGKTGAELQAQFPPPNQVLAQIAARQGISRDSAKLMADNDKVAKKKNKGEEAMMAGDAPQTRQITAADSVKLRQAQQESYRVVGELSSAKVARAVASERQLNEVMVDFWENHFSVFAGKDRTRYFLPEYEANAIRPNALGKFRTLLGAVAKSPAMLYYLDNWQSVADSGRPTLASPPQRRLAANNGARMQGRAGRMQQMTVGELIDRNLLPKAQEQRFSKLPPERLAELRSLTLAEAQQRMQQFAPLVANRRPKGVNENYARELMELHTLGVDGGYTQADVVQVARALTGWTIANGPNGGDFTFRKETHDAGAKVILGQQFPAGQGVEDGEQVLDMLAKHPATAKYIATKLARRFVSDVPPPALVDRAAKVFLNTDGDIRETLRAIITSPEFFSTAAYRAKVKSPFELVVSTMRAMGAQPDSTPRVVQFVSRLGQPMFGHQAPDGYPEVGSAWMNTGSILNRINFGLAAASGRVPGIRMADWSATRDLAALPREQQVDGVIRALLGGEASTDTRQVLLTGTNPFLQGKAAADSFAVDADDNAMGTINSMTGPPAGAGARRTAAAEDRRMARADQVPLSRQQAQAAREAAKPGQGASLTQAIGNLPPATGLAQIVGLALGAPEFQRR